MRILVLGAGAVGGYFGGRLAEAKADVTFLVRSARAAKLAAQGLVVESPLGDMRLPVRAITADRVERPFDIVLLTAKAYDLDDAIAAIRPAVGPDTAIVPVLNGLVHLDRLDAAFAPDNVLGGVAYIAATLTPDGIVRHLNRANGITIGKRGDGSDPRVRALVDAFAGTPVQAVASTDILLDLWEKFVMLATLAALTSMMRGSVGEIMAADEGEALMLELLGETEAVAAASGHPTRPQHRAQCRAMLTDRNSDFSASMRRDLESGRQTEADAVIGDMLTRARALGLAAPLLRTAYCHLQVYERRRERVG
jgi:2-dehydropantoate 2-reductase